MGICPTISGTQYYFDCFDTRFRQYNYLDWTVKYDPADMDRILVAGDEDRVRFVCEQKHVQPMALADRQEGDSDELTRVRQYNRELKEMVMERNADDFDRVRSLMEEVGKDEIMLSKVLLTDSQGRHKDRRNQARLTGSARKALEAAMEKEAVETEREQQRENADYLNRRVNFAEFLQ